MQAATTTSQSSHSSKIVQSQSRTAASQLNSSKESGSAKPVWGNIKPPTAVPLRADVQSDDFPTAAEVANGMCIVF
jgi:hypothetical protein